MQVAVQWFSCDYYSSFEIVFGPAIVFFQHWQMEKPGIMFRYNKKRGYEKQGKRPVDLMQLAPVLPDYFYSNLFSLIFSLSYSPLIETS